MKNVIAGMLVVAIADAVIAFCGEMPIVKLSRKTSMEYISPEGRRNDTTMDEVEYTQGTMRRFDFRGYVGGSPRNSEKMPPPRMMVINDCATRQTLTVDLDAREYVEGTLPDYTNTQQNRKRPEAESSGSSTLVESETHDTGEVESFFGHVAHHLITTEKRRNVIDNEHLRQAISQTTTIDGWYLDFEVPTRNCLPPVHTGSMPVLSFSSEPPVVKHVGPIPQGLAVKMVRTSRTEVKAQQGNPTDTVTTIRQEITELSETPLDPALFQIPAGFRRVEHLYRH